MDKESLVQHWKDASLIKDQRVLDAFRSVKREYFVLPEDKKDSYEDIPLQIPAHQTISQPTTVMIMTQALNVEEGNKILEVGTGSGYQAAVISQLVRAKGHIYSTELHKELVEYARKNLRMSSVSNVTVLQSDGSLGLPQYAPYDRIIVTAAAPKVPSELVRQLKVGGTMVIPVGPSYSQKMLQIGKTDTGVETANLGDFVFVPLRGKAGFQ